MRRAMILLALIVASGYSIARAGDSEKADAYCLRYSGDIAGGLRKLENICSYPINFTFCYAGPDITPIVQCEKQHFGSDRIPASSTTAITGPETARLVLPSVVGCRNEYLPINQKFSFGSIVFECLGGEDNATQQVANEPQKKNKRSVASSSGAKPMSTPRSTTEVARAESTTTSQSERTDSRTDADREGARFEELMARGGETIAGFTMMDCHSFFRDGEEDEELGLQWMALSANEVPGTVVLIGIDESGFGTHNRHIFKGVSTVRTGQDGYPIYSIDKSGWRFEVGVRDHHHIRYAYKIDIETEPNWIRSRCENFK